MVNIKKRLVVTMSSCPLTEAQTSLLARGPKFAVCPRHAPKGDYTAAVKEVCLHFPPIVAAELRADTGKPLDKTHPPSPASPSKKPGLSRN